MASEAKAPGHEAVYSKLRDMILFGDLAPRQPVTLNGLTNEIGTSIMPVREGVRRLMAQGALESTGTRRVVVPAMTLHKLEQIRYMRNQIEPKLATLAARYASQTLLDELHKIDDKVNEALANGNVQKYLEFNYRFHFKLYEASGNEVLYDIAQLLWLKIGPSLRIVFGKVGTENLPDMHDEAMKSILDGDEIAAGNAIAQDIAQGMDHIEKALEYENLNQIA